MEAKMQRILWGMLAAAVLALSNGDVWADGLKLKDCGVNVWGLTYHAKSGQNGINPGLGAKCYAGVTGWYGDVNHVFRNSQSRNGKSLSASAIGFGYEHPIARMLGKEIRAGAGLEYIFSYQTAKGKTLQGWDPVLSLVVVADKTIEYNIAFPAVFPSVFDKRVKNPLDEIWFFLRIPWK